MIWTYQAYGFMSCLVHEKALGQLPSMGIGALHLDLTGETPR